MEYILSAGIASTKLERPPLLFTNDFETLITSLSEAFDHTSVEPMGQILEKFQGTE